MQVAQRLYEGKTIGEKGSIGLITYMRTDSTRTADEALAAVRDFIGKTYGGGALPEEARRFRQKKDAQDAHEAIRPDVDGPRRPRRSRGTCRPRSSSSTASSGTVSSRRR